MIFNFFRSSRVAAEEHKVGNGTRNAPRTNQEAVRLARLLIITLSILTDSITLSILCSAPHIPPRQDPEITLQTPLAIAVVSPAG